VPFIHHVRVRYAEVDAQGVVFNAHWLTYFDEAMTRYFEDLGYEPSQTWTEGGPFDVMLVKTAIEWRGSAGFDDVVAIAVRASRLGGASFDLAFSATVDGREVVTATTTYVTVEPGARRSCPIPDDVRARLEPDLQTVAGGGAPHRQVGAG
jgi:acyl-CoA thioester hydrolase